MSIDLIDKEKIKGDILPYERVLIKCINFLKDIQNFKRNTKLKKIVKGIEEIFYEAELEKYLNDEFSRIFINLNKKTISCIDISMDFTDKNSLYSVFKTIVIQDVLSQLQKYIEKIKMLINQKDTISTLVEDKIDINIVELISEICNKGITTYVDVLKGINNKSLVGYNIQNHPSWKLLENDFKTNIRARIENLIDKGILLQIDKKASFGHYTAIVVGSDIEDYLHEYGQLKSFLIKTNNGFMPTNKDYKNLKLEDILTNIEKGFVVPDYAKFKTDLSLKRLVIIVNILEKEIFFDEPFWKSVSIKLDKFPKEFITYLEFELKATDNYILRRNLTIIIEKEKSKC